MQKRLNPVRYIPQVHLAAVSEPVGTALQTEREAATTESEQDSIAGHWRTLGRVGCLFGIIAIMAVVLDAMITTGFRQIKTSAFGAANLMMNGQVNSEIVITGSSRALAHYDPRTIQALTGRTAFNLGRNGTQTDIQLAVLKAYLKHNRKPEVVLHNLDVFTFVLSHDEVYDPTQYIPYLYDEELYGVFRRIYRDSWKDRYIPLYGYVVEDVNLPWAVGLKGFFGWSPREDYFMGFRPGQRRWTDDFQRFKASHPLGVHREIEPAGIHVLEELVRTCQHNGIQLIFVYSPEYLGMQRLTNNRTEVFDRFREVANRFRVPLWDYSGWENAGNQDFFYNSQHLNATGAAVFSVDLANRVKAYLAAKPNAFASQPSTTSVRSQAGRN